MFEEQYCVTVFRDSTLASVGGQWNLTPGADADIDNLSEAVDDDDDWDVNGAIDGEPAQRICVKRKFLDLPHECWSKKQGAPTSVLEAVEFAQKLLLSTDTSVNAVE